MLTESPSVYVVLRIPDAMDEAEAREAGIQRWLDLPTSPGATPSARRV